jgi:hypothetical protein
MLLPDAIIQARDGLDALNVRPSELEAGIDRLQQLIRRVSDCAAHHAVRVNERGLFDA